MKIIIPYILVLLFVVTGCGFDNQINPNKDIAEDSNDININKIETKKEILVIPQIRIQSDKDSDGITDLLDIVEGARLDAKNKPLYKSNYYDGGYPPDNEGVCTDVIWRAYKNAGYSIKDLIDKDIKENVEEYPRVDSPDPNIDFRRVVNLHVFFEKFGLELTNEIIQKNKENLSQWQGGDVVIFTNPEHIAIISNRRRDDGVPYIIHNAGPYTKEADHLLLWKDKIIGHYRFPAE